MDNKHASSLVFALLCGLCSPAHAQAPAGVSAPTLWINGGMRAFHYERADGLRENNVGIGIDWVVAPDHMLMAGNFANSLNQRSHLLMYNWRPFHWQVASFAVHAGVAAGLTDGYSTYRDGGWFPLALPLVSVERGRLGANVGVIPTLPGRVRGAVVIQLKLGIH